MKRTCHFQILEIPFGFGRYSVEAEIRESRRTDPGPAPTPNKDFAILFLREKLRVRGHFADFSADPYRLYPINTAPVERHGDCYVSY
jgi:hypothetical protein